MHTSGGCFAAGRTGPAVGPSALWARVQLWPGPAGPSALWAQAKPSGTERSVGLGPALTQPSRTKRSVGSGPALTWPSSTKRSVDSGLALTQPSRTERSVGLGPAWPSRTKRSAGSGPALTRPSGTKRSVGSGPAWPSRMPSPDPALTGEARWAAADVAFGPVVAEGQRQPRDDSIEVGPGELQAVTAGQAGAAVALSDVLLTVGARVPCGDTTVRAQ